MPRKPLYELLEPIGDLLNLLALHASASEKSQAILTFLGDYVENLQSAGTPADRRMIGEIRQALENHGLPIAAVEIALMGGLK